MARAGRFWALGAGGLSRRRAQERRGLGVRAQAGARRDTSQCRFRCPGRATAATPPTDQWAASVVPGNQAALDAVKQWKYLPTLLNGVPTPVFATITVKFALD